jgi:hypothetical protein
MLLETILNVLYKVGKAGINVFPVVLVHKDIIKAYLFWLFLNSAPGSFRDWPRH